MYPLYFFIAGMLFTYVGIRHLFDTGFFSHMSHLIGKNENQVPSSASKYPTGLRFLLVGIILIVYSLAEFFEWIDIVGIIVGT